MVSYLLDTCVPIDVFRGKASTIHWLEQVPAKQVTISSITVMELQTGIECATVNVEKKKEQLRRFLSVYDVLPFATKDAIETALVRAKLQKQGQLIGPYDLQIAGMAINNDLTLVTGNVKEFSRVENLRIENP